MIPVGFRTSAAGALGCCADTAGSGVWVCTGERATIPPHKLEYTLSDEPIAYRRPHVVAVSRADVQRVSEGSEVAELPLWRNMAGLLEEAPDLGAAPWGYSGIVFDGLWRAEGAYAVLADQGVRAVYPKEYSGVPEWVAPAPLDQVNDMTGTSDTELGLCSTCLRVSFTFPQNRDRGFVTVHCTIGVPSPPPPPHLAPSPLPLQGLQAA